MSNPTSDVGVLASVVAPADGVVTDVFVNDDSQVDNNQVIMTFKPNTTDIQATRGGKINILVEKGDNVLQGKVLAQIK